jgi:hypothetical protein
MHDSNSKTADHLARLLRYVRAKMKDWGYLDEEWRFVGETEELVEILRSKTRFQRGPRFVVPAAPDGPPLRQPTGEQAPEGRGASSRSGDARLAEDEAP